jgi:hypothetical protein
MGIDIRPSILLTAALRDHRGAAVAFRYQGGSSKVAFHAGSIPIGAQSETIDLHNGWHVEVFGTVTGAGLLGNGNSLARLLDGVGISLAPGASPQSIAQIAGKKVSPVPCPGVTPAARGLRQAEPLCTSRLT